MGPAGAFAGAETDGLSKMSTEDACFCDYDPPDAYWEKRPIARKTHRCNECATTIHTGERYEMVDSLSDGHFSRFRTCVFCLAIRDMMTARCCCFCWAHENMLEDVRGELAYNGYKMPGLAMATGRIMIEARCAK